MKEHEHIDAVRRYFDACNSGVLEDFKPTLAIDEIIAQGDRVVGEWSLIWTPPGSSSRLKMRGSEWYEMRSGVIGEVRAYFAYDETRNAELTGFPYRDRRYLME